MDIFVKWKLDQIFNKIFDKKTSKFLYDIFFSENASETIKKINDENIVPILTTFLDAELFEMKNVLLTGIYIVLLGIFKPSFFP